MNLIGKTTINPLLFYSGKICGYITWVLYFLFIFEIFIINYQPLELLKLLSYVLSGIGLILISISIINLGRSTRLGLPSENTTFKNNGLYRYSRNPMYLGFNLLTLSSIIFSADISVAIIGIYSIIIYHYIIIGEELFLEKRFGGAYIDYKKKVRRYL